MASATAHERRVPRIVAVDDEEQRTTEHFRSSAAIRSDIGALSEEREAAVAELGRLDGARADVLLTGTDDDAEQHDALIRKQRRIIERTDLRGPALAHQLREAEQRERDEARAKQQADATAVIEAVIADVETYNAAARTIATFLGRWMAASATASAAGVPGPDERLRSNPGWMEPAREESYTVFIDPRGVVHERMPQPSMLVEDRKTGKMVNPNANEHSYLAGFRTEQRTRMVPAKNHHGQFLTPLANAVSLPAATFNQPTFWPVQRSV